MTQPTSITPADIEAKFRDIQGQVETVSKDSRKKVALAGAVAAALIVVVIYLTGRRAGRKRSTVLEIRRI